MGRDLVDNFHIGVDEGSALFTNEALNVMHGDLLGVAEEDNKPGSKSSSLSDALASQVSKHPLEEHRCHHEWRCCNKSGNRNNTSIYDGHLGFDRHAELLHVFIVPVVQKFETQADLVSTHVRL